MTFMTYWCDCS